MIISKVAMVTTNCMEEKVMIYSTAMMTMMNCEETKATIYYTAVKVTIFSTVVVDQTSCTVVVVTIAL